MKPCKTISQVDFKNNDLYKFTKVTNRNNPHSIFMKLRNLHNPDLSQIFKKGGLTGPQL